MMRRIVTQSCKAYLSTHGERNMSRQILPLRKITHWRPSIVIIIHDSVVFYLILVLDRLGQHPQGRCSVALVTPVSSSAFAYSY